MDNQELLLEKIQESNATVQLCLICKKMKAMTICDVCNKCCCGSCLKSTLLVVNNHNLYGGVCSPMMIKRCPRCFKSRAVQSDIQEIKPSTDCNIQ